MRALRKIIFVNSANIRYAEVKLDGNVRADASKCVRLQKF